MTAPPIQPPTASRTAKLIYWATHGLAGNWTDAQRAADLAYNAAVVNGPASFREAYKLREINDLETGGINSVHCI